jgi:hypothetical protein
MLNQYMLYPYLLPLLAAMVTGFRCGLWHPPMAHMLLLAKPLVFILPAPLIPCPFKGFRCGLWHPPTAHKMLPAKFVAMIPSPPLQMLYRMPHPGFMGMFTGFRCRPHLRV